MTYLQTVAGRFPARVDVLIDCAGALFGLFLLFGLYVAVRHHRRKDLLIKVKPQNEKSEKNF